MKTKNKNITPVHSTIIAGYVLFALLVITVALSTVLPWGQLFFAPHVKRLSVVVSFIALSAGAILPAFLAYFVANNAITSKRPQTHHFNGVLFGLLAYWLISFFSLFDQPFLPDGNSTISLNLRLVLANFLPVAGVTLVVLVIAFFYARRHMGSLTLINYKPYWVTLVALMLFTMIGTVVYGYLTHTANIFSFIPLGIVLLFGVVSYAMLRKSRLKQTEKIAWSGLSVTVLFTTAFVLSSLVSEIFSYVQLPGITAEISVTIVIILLTLAGWWLYWRTTTAGLRRRR